MPRGSIVLPPSDNLLFDFYNARDGGFSTTYASHISHHNGGRAEASKTAQAKAKDGHDKTRALINGPFKRGVASCPDILKLAKEIRESESGASPAVDADFVQTIRRKHRTDHVCALKAAPKREQEDLSMYSQLHKDHGAIKPDKSFFMKKTFYTQYTEELAKQAGLMGEKK